MVVSLLRRPPLLPVRGAPTKGVVAAVSPPYPEQCRLGAVPRTTVRLPSLNRFPRPRQSPESLVRSHWIKCSRSEKSNAHKSLPGKRGGGAINKVGARSPKGGWVPVRVMQRSRSGTGARRSVRKSGTGRSPPLLLSPLQPKLGACLHPHLPARGHGFQPPPRNQPARRRLAISLFRPTQKMQHHHPATGERCTVVIQARMVHGAGNVHHCTDAALLTLLHPFLSPNLQLLRIHSWICNVLQYRLQTPISDFSTQLFSSVHYFTPPSSLVFRHSATPSTHCFTL